MAKRELCYKEDVKKNHEKWIGYLDEDMITRLNIAVDKHITTFSEQDIVEPYLDRLKTQICNLTAEYDTETVHIDALMDLIDNLLSEQGELSY